MKNNFTLLLLLWATALSSQTGEWTVFKAERELTALAARANTILTAANGSGLVRFEPDGTRSFINTSNSDLPSDEITHLAIDEAGHWWTKSPLGFSRYDGTNWQSWSLPEVGLPDNALVNALRPAPDSSLYVATNAGLAIYRQGAWSVINTSNAAIPTNAIWDVAFGPDGKTYYATTTFGVVVQDGDSWAFYNNTNTGLPLMRNVYSLGFADDGSLWTSVGLPPQTTLRLTRFDGTAWTLFTGPNIGLPDNTIFRRIQTTEDGKLWMTTTTSLSMLEQGNWTHRLSAEIGCTPDNNYPAIDATGQVWVLTSCQLTRFDGQAWQPADAGLEGHCGGNILLGLAEDLDGNIWMGANFGCISSTDGLNWAHYYPTQLGAADNNINTIFADAEGKMWVGLDYAQLLVYEQGSWTLIDTCASAFSNHWVKIIAQAPNGDHWFAFEPITTPATPLTGMARRSAAGEWTFFPSNDLPINPLFGVQDIAFDAVGIVWMTTIEGLLRYDGQNWTLFTTDNSPLPNNRLFGMTVAPDGAIWMCGDGGLTRYDGQNWTITTTDNSGLPSNITRRIAFDQAGGMYVGYGPQGTGAKVAVLRGGTWTELLPPGWETSFNYQPLAFLVDSRNRLWFAESGEFDFYRFDPMLVGTQGPTPNLPTLSVWPNPAASDQLWLERPHWLQGTARLSVFNTLGQPVLQQWLPATDTDTTPSIDISTLPAGLYWLSLGQGSQIATAKFLKP